MLQPIHQRIKRRLKAHFRKKIVRLCIKAHGKTYYCRHDVKVKPGPHDPGPRDPVTRDPGLPPEFKSGTPGPPSKFKSGAQDPLRSLKVGHPHLS